MHLNIRHRSGKYLRAEFRLHIHKARECSSSLPPSLQAYCLSCPQDHIHQKIRNITGTNYCVNRRVLHIQIAKMGSRSLVLFQPSRGFVFSFFFFSLANSIDTIKQKRKMYFVRAVGPSSFLYWIYLKWWSWLDLCCSTGTMTQKAFFFFLFMVKISNAIFFQRHIFISAGLHSLPSILLWLTRDHQMHSAQVTNTRVCSREFFFLPFPL